MRIFLTGATGFIGTHIIPELQAAGHAVLGLTRSDAGARTLAAAGIEAYRGDLEDLASLRAGAARADAVIHCAFDHDFNNFVANCAKDSRAIDALGHALGDRGPLLITSGTGIGSPGDGQLAREDVCNIDHPNPRVASEIAGHALRAAGVDVRVVRLPQVHDPVKQGLISPYIEIARVKGVAGYVGDGTNRWPAAHVLDAAKLYVLALDRGQSGRRYHAVAEEGVSARAIAEVVGNGLGLPVTSVSAEDAAGHFGWFGMFAALDMPASGAWTQRELGWHPGGPGLIADLAAMDFAGAV